MKNKPSYLLRGTPSMLLALGAGFVMASSSSIKAALGMGAAVILSLLLTSLVVSLIHKIIPSYAKVPVYLIIITGFVSIISMLMDAYFPDVVSLLGVHLATLSVSAVIFRDAEEVADVHTGGRAIVTALITGAFLTAIMLICALIREPIQNASIFGYQLELLKDYKVASAAGTIVGYIVLAIVLAVINKITGLHKDHVVEENNEEEGN